MNELRPAEDFPAEHLHLDETTPETKHVGTFVKNKEVAERMLAGAQRHLNTVPKIQAELRINGIRLTDAKLRGTIRRASQQRKRKAFKGSEGFEASARAQQRGAGSNPRTLARQRAKAFNAEHGVTEHG